MPLLEGSDAPVLLCEIELAGFKTPFIRVGGCQCECITWSFWVVELRVARAGSWEVLPTCSLCCCCLHRRAKRARNLNSACLI